MNEQKLKGKRKERIDPMTINERFILDFSFTSMQKEAIKLIYEMRILSTSQLAQILERDIKYVRDQLLKLYKNGFLYRQFPPVEIGKGSKEAYWMLDRGGALFIAGAYGVSVKSLNWEIRDNLIKFEKLAHSIKISEIRTRIEEAAKEKGHKIESCLCDRHLYYEFNDGDKKFVLRPDIYLIYNDGNKLYQYFFEVDMGTMTITGPQNRTSVVVSKIPKYELFRKEAWKGYFDVYPRVIFLTSNKNRALYMSNAIKETRKSKMEFLISTFDFIDEDPLGNIYITLDGEETNMFE